MGVIGRGVLATSSERGSSWALADWSYDGGSLFRRQPRRLSGPFRGNACGHRKPWRSEDRIAEQVAPQSQSNRGNGRSFAEVPRSSPLNDIRCQILLFGLQGAGLATPYVSEAESWQVAATWQAADRTSLAAGFARADSFGAVELKQSTWSASVDHAWDTHRIRLGFALDDLDDYNGTLLGYDADLWYAEFSTQLD